MKIGIAGYGHVGIAMHKLFKQSIIYDKNIKKYEDKLSLNKVEIIFICVPTPMKKNGSCDTSIVEEIIRNYNPKLFIIRSTIEIGFTDYVSKKYQKNVVFQPEYYGETVDHPFSDLKNQNWITFGGEQKNIDIAIQVYQKVKNSNIKINQLPAKEVELAKYMENAFLATKIIFINEMYDIAKSMNINFNLVREAWISDPRIGTSHTFVYENNRGYGGKCLAKDISSLIYQAKLKKADVQLLETIVRKNNKYQK